MKDKLMGLLVKESFWTNILNYVGIFATGSSMLLDPHVTGYVSMGFLALTGPAGKGVAKGLNSLTSDYAKTETLADDALHAASSAILKK